MRSIRQGIAIDERVPLPDEHDPGRRARGDRGQDRGRLFRRRPPAPRLAGDGRTRASTSDARCRPAQTRLQSRRSGPAPELARLYDAAAVRERCRLVQRWVADGRSPHFTLDESRLAAVAAYVAEVTRAAYPDLTIPYHSRWRHFSAGGIDRWSALAHASRRRTASSGRASPSTSRPSASCSTPAPATPGATASRRPGTSFARSEGLAVASLDMFRAGAFSCRSRVSPVASTTRRSERIDAATLARHFQVDAEQSADRRGAAQRAAAPAWHGARRPARSVRPRAGAARQPGRLFSLRAPTAGALRPPTLLATLLDEPVVDLAVGADARRRRRRRCRPPSGGAHGRRHRRHRAVPQALPMADLFAARAARTRRARGGTARRAHRAAGISQRRPAGRSRRDPSARADRSAAAARGLVRADRRMARADRGADGPAGRAWCAASSASAPASPCRTCCKAAPGAPAARSRASCARRTARRRSRSCRTARCFRGA